MMIDVKARNNQQEASQPAAAPPAYPHAETLHSPGLSPQSQSQWQWRGQSSQPSQSQPGVPHTMSVSEIGTQYRNAQFAQCAMGNHQRKTRYGPCGIITAVIFFPVGLICLFIDTEHVCTTCGNRL